MTNCPTCGTSFESGKEPWTIRKNHCAKHDMTYPQGSECPTCKANVDDAAERERIAKTPVAVDDAAKKAADDANANKTVA